MFGWDGKGDERKRREKNKIREEIKSFHQSH